MCVCCHPIYSGRLTCGRTSRGHAGGRSHRICPPSFCGACLSFSRVRDSSFFPSSTVKSNFVYPRQNRSPLNGHDLFIFIHPVVVCLCVFSSHLFWTIKFVGRTSRGHTGFLIHLPSAVRALIFLARRIQPFISLVDREVEFCVLTVYSFSTCWAFYFYFITYGVQQTVVPIE